MTNFHTFLTTAKPLYTDGTMKVNFTVDELVKFVEDYMKDNQPIVTVEMHEPNKEFDEKLQDVIDKINRINHSQDNHFHTK